MPLVSRTRATLRSAEFGFFGVTVYTRVQTPRFCGAPRSAGVFVLDVTLTRGFRTSWLIVGMRRETLRFPFGGKRTQPGWAATANSSTGLFSVSVLARLPASP